MKKRLLMICLAGAFAFSLAGCGQQSAGEAQNAENAADAQQEQEAENTQKPETQESAISENEEEQDAGENEDAASQDEGGSEESSALEEGDDMVSFWGSTMIANSVSDSYASIQDAYVDGGMLVINGTYDITTDDGEVLDTSDAGEHSFPLSGNVSMGSMGGDEEPETMDADTFNEILQYDLQNNPGLGLVFCVENEKVVEIWITS